ncbi:MAG: APC family permease [Acidimicrobiales bacterium]|jgi:amino acid transporter
MTSSVTTSAGRAPEEGLKSGALGLISSVVIGVASTAPAYSMAATLGFVVAAIGVQAPIVTVLAFFPMWFISMGYQQMNNVDPDCGTTFTWATRAFTPRVGWMGGWGIIAADVIVMASLAQIAGQYLFDLFNATRIGDNAASPWVLLVGILWIVFMSWICYVGIEMSANFQKALLGIELTMLAVMSIWALIRVGDGTAPAGHLAVTGSWFDPFAVKHFSDFVVGLTDMLFIYWGWDTAVSVNEETADSETVPGKAAVLSTFVLLATYTLVILSVQSFAGIGTTGIGLGNPSHTNDVLSILGPAIFGHSTFASVLDHLLLLMVLSSAAASTQTTILPNARTTLSMAVYKSIPSAFAKIHKRHLTPTVSTVAMGASSIALYVVMNFLSAGHVISDSVDSLGVMIAFYYGLTGFACAWYYRKTLTSNVRNFFLQGVFPTLGGLIMYVILGWSFWYYWQPANSSTHWGVLHRQIGGTFILDVGTLLLGVVLMFAMEAFRPAFFRGETLSRNSATLVSEEFPAKQESALRTE